MKRLKQAPNLKSSIDSFVERIKNRSLDPDDLQAALRDFVHNTHTTLSEHPLWKKASAHELQEAELHLQEYLFFETERLGFSLYIIPYHLAYVIYFFKQCKICIRTLV